MCNAMASLAEECITLAGLDSVPIEVISKGLMDSSIFGLHLLAARIKTYGSVIGEKLLY